MTFDANELRLLMSRETSRRRTEIWVGEMRAQWRRTEKLRPWGPDDPRIRLLQLASQVPDVRTPHIAYATLIYEVPQPFPLAFGLLAVDVTKFGSAFALSVVRLHQHEGEVSPPTAAVARVYAAVVSRQVISVADDVTEQIERAALAFSTGASPRLLHGNLGLASVVESATGFQLIAGDDLAWGPRELDVGWLLGDLLEHARLRSDDRNETLTARRLGQSFLREYARLSLHTLRIELVKDFVVCRILHHALEAETLMQGNGAKIIELLPEIPEWIGDLQESSTEAEYDS